MHLIQTPSPSSSLSVRIDFVDALRGFALLGLFLVHCSEYFELYWKDPAPSVIHDVVFFLFAGKAYALFALLFGWSFFTMMDRQAAKGVDFGPRFLKLIFLLLVLGVLHGLLYAGDILQVLAVLGFVLVGINRFSKKWIWAIALFFLLNIPLLIRILAVLFHLPGANQQPLHWSLGAITSNIWAHGNLLQVLQVNLLTGMLSKWDFFWASGRIFLLLAMFSIGLLVGRSGLLSHPEPIRNGMRWWLISLFLGTVLWGLQYQLAFHPWELLEEEGMARYYLSNWIEGLFSLCILLSWLFTLVWAWGTGPGQYCLKWLSPAGRMSLSIYVAQSVVCVPLFYGFGAGWYAYIGQGYSLLFGIAFFAAQVVMAHWWMKRFYYGPLEWCWRAATYGSTRIPFVRRVQP